VYICLGSVFWEAKSVNFMTTWSSFNVLVMPDFTGDGVPELITAHSSDPRFPPEVRVLSTLLCGLLIGPFHVSNCL